MKTSSELIESTMDNGELVLALDGTTLDEPTVAAIEGAAAVPGAMPPSSVARS